MERLSTRLDEVCMNLKFYKSILLPEQYYLPGSKDTGKTHPTHLLEYLETKIVPWPHGRKSTWVQHRAEDNGTTLGHIIIMTWRLGRVVDVEKKSRREDFENGARSVLYPT